MQLEIGNGQVVREPSAEFVAGVLNALAGPMADSYIILVKGECQFMQGSGLWKDGFVLEYQEGSVDEHFQCRNRKLPLADTIAAFQSYLDGNDRWRTMFEWRKIKVRRPWWRFWHAGA